MVSKFKVFFFFFLNKMALRTILGNDHGFEDYFSLRGDSARGATRLPDKFS